MYDVYLKAKINSLEEWRNHILICKEMEDFELKDKYPALIKRDNGWDADAAFSKASSVEIIERLKSVKDIEKFKKVLNDRLEIEIQDPPKGWKKKLFGGDFHNPN